MLRAERSSGRPGAVLVGLSLLCALAVVAGTAKVASAAKKPWERIKHEDLRAIEIPGYQRHVLENGLVVYLMEDHTWPLVEGSMLVRTGSVYEPAKKIGLAEITGDVLRTGGTRNIGSDELDEKLERMGAYIESSIGQTSGEIEFSFLAKDAKEGLGLVADVVRNPAFEQDKIDVAKTGVRAAIARRNDEEMGILQRELPKAVWGADHPYARQAEYTTVDAIDRKDIVSFYESFYHPNQAMLAVWGDIDPAQVLPLVKASFGDWPKGDNQVPPLPELPKSGERRVLVANKDDVTQTWFAVGQVGMKADDPDYFAMSIMNRILGGGFGDRLFNQVRSTLGYAYGVGSTDGTAMEHPGTFLAYCGTKSSTTDDALAAVLHEIDKMRDAPVTDKELQGAKDAILNSHVFNFARRSQVLQRLQTYEYYGYPADFLDRYVAGIKAVDAAKVQDVAKRRLHPDQFSIVAVGKVAEWDNDLTQFGPVEKLDISIPEPKGEEFPPPTTETIEKGRATLASAQTAMGGKALTSLKSLRVSQSIGLNIQGMSLAATATRSVVYPDKLHMSVKLPFGEMVQAVNGTAAWVKGPQGIQDVSGADAQELTEELLGDPFYLLGHFDQYQVQALAGEPVGDAPANVVLARLGDTKWLKLYFDAKTNLLVKTSTMGKDMVTQVPGLQEIFYQDLRPIAGIKYPHKARMLQAGQEQMTQEVTSVEVNPAIDGALFARPQS